ncbi:hypothetical protein G6O69_25705 [Pseudenhygromyxa sp. WMMC2535]|uniref:hypothetical protein n=1 Tax=Pseudenhygromyxa sp. WMMC2535 TaxID=2712867 RepID=UPI001552AA65|nr:hypothetical protein [Pseudenhygromyxa sp. WMMC2535]NVB41261.1 hypothetical protein [Pseudenhygromyxa sp. WMMC2535]
MSRAPAHVLAVGALLAFALAGSGCGLEGVEARALWLDSTVDGGERRLHVYDRGELWTLDVLGPSAPIEHLRLGPKGRGVLVRAGTRAGAWVDLEDQRRLLLQLPPVTIAGPPRVQLSSSGTALFWIADDGGLELVPLAPGLGLERREDDDTIIPLRAEGAYDWAQGASAAPVLLAVGDGATRLELLRYPEQDAEASAELGLGEVAVVEGLSLPVAPSEARSCELLADCGVLVAMDPAGRRVIFADGESGSWQSVDARTPELSGALELPAALVEAGGEGGVGLLHVVDREVSIWQAGGSMHRWDERRGSVDSFPLFVGGPYWWFVADEGEAVVLASIAGPVLRADAEGLEPLSLETSPCTLSGEPVVSPSGTWVAWACFDESASASASFTSGALIRVSPSGLERLAGVPMVPLALDDDGALLLHSVQTVYLDLLDGVESQDVPRSLFVLSGDGVLTRVDDLEPAPAPVFPGTSEIGAYIQAVALPR